ncbi:TIGR03943 family protein [Streptomyces coacervatus]|uniref:TIGR03943 family protein n=1 Tax=Streptomyces coacervatus TaxID=647381 RepID=A0ABP7HIB7_9ACTN|nr:TIGR03943 family protein [Streptomyces coacervatus]MDF2271498.1 TIGR03943 family protein [Streptomyces coacervatus]
MRRYGPAALLLLTGGAVLRITLFGDLYLRYVQPALRPYLIVSGAALMLLGLTTGLTTAAHHDGHGHGHGHGHGVGGPRVAWLLTLPALALLLFPPPALGSYSAGRDAAQRAAQGVGAFPALPAGNPVELTLGEFSSRAMYDSGRSLKGRTVRMTGFVTHGDDGTWYLTRLQVSCCAADAGTGKVEIRGTAADGPWPADTWLTVTGTWHPKGRLGTDAAWPPVLDATSAKQVKQPADPYEKR